MKPTTHTIAFHPDSSRPTSGSPKSPHFCQGLPRILGREKPSLFPRFDQTQPKKPILASEELICCHLVAFSQCAGHPTLRRGIRTTRLEVGCLDLGAGLCPSISEITSRGFFENKSISLSHSPPPSLPLCLHPPPPLTPFSEANRACFLQT